MVLGAASYSYITGLVNKIIRSGLFINEEYKKALNALDIHA